MRILGYTLDPWWVGVYRPRTNSGVGPQKEREKMIKPPEKMEHPMPCSKCRANFDAWGYTLAQRTRGPWRGLCMPCREAATLQAWRGTGKGGA